MYLKEEFIFEDKEISKLNNKGPVVIIHTFPALRKVKGGRALSSRSVRAT